MNERLSLSEIEKFRLESYKRDKKIGILPYGYIAEEVQELLIREHLINIRKKEIRSVRLKRAS